MATKLLENSSDSILQAMGAVLNGPNRRETHAQPSNEGELAVRNRMQRLALVSKEGSLNKLPETTSDHSYLYGERGALI